MEELGGKDLFISQKEKKKKGGMITWTLTLRRNHMNYKIPQFKDLQGAVEYKVPLMVEVDKRTMGKELSGIFFK